MLKKAVAYMRVSSKEQEKEGFSIPAQAKLLREYAQKNNIQIVKEFADSETAKKAGREQFGLMLEHVEKTEVKTILVEKTDRLYRNFRDYVTLDDIDNLEIHLVKEGEVLSKDSKSHQKFIHGIKVLMAKNYIDNLSEETKKGLYEKAESGFYPAPAPIGYLNVKDESEKRMIVRDDKNGPLMARIFEMYDSGNYSIDTLQAWAKEQDLRSCNSKQIISRSALSNCLKNPFYYGDFQYVGKLYKGVHEPLISKTLWDRVQQRLTRSKPKIQSKHGFQFSGLLTCGDCGCAIVGELKKGKYVYYHCSRMKKECGSKAVYIREEVLAQQFEETVKSIKVPDEIITYVVNALKESCQDKSKYQEEEIARLRSKVDQLRNRKKQAYLDKLDGILDEKTWQEYSNKWQEEIGTLEARLAAYDKADIPYYESGQKILELAKHAHDLYLRGASQEKKEILKLIHSNSRLIGGKLEPELKSPFHLMVKWASSLSKLRLLDSNQRPSDYSDSNTFVMAWTISLPFE